MRTQHMLMNGLSRSPILANFQKTPMTLLFHVSIRTVGRVAVACNPYPSLFLSMIPGVKWWTYALVQMRRRSVRRRDWKLKRADYGSF